MLHKFLPRLSLTLPTLLLRPHYSFLQTKLTEPLLKQLQLEYKISPTFSLFQPHITTNSDYFKIFQLIEKEPFCAEMYRALKDETGKIKEQNDNMRLLRARVVCRIAEDCARRGANQEAERLFNQSLEIFQQSLVPQVLQYYSVYRQYGLFLQSIDQPEKAAEILSQSVEIMREYVKMSEDPVTANSHSIEQAKACVKLIYLQPESRDKWLKLANEYWRECQRGVHEQIQYAQTVYENCVDRCKVNAKKARLYAEGELDRIKNQKYHPIILRVFGQDKP